MTNLFYTVMTFFIVIASKTSKETSFIGIIIMKTAKTTWLCQQQGLYNWHTDITETSAAL